MVVPKFRRYQVPHDYLPRRMPHLRDAEIRAAVAALVARYGLLGKRILSLGAGRAYEERWLAELGGNFVTAVDHSREIEDMLVHGGAGDMVYYIGDALAACFPAAFDAVYASGFTPDEMRRGAICAKGQWPLSAAPFHPALVRHGCTLPPGGLLIVQSFCNGVDVSRHPNFIPSIEQQLAGAAMRLIDIHAFEKSRGVMLCVAQKIGARTPALAEPLTRFHGRSELDERPVRIWPRDHLLPL